jgi:hypothetical protein
MQPEVKMLICITRRSWCFPNLEAIIQSYTTWTSQPENILQDRLLIFGTGGDMEVGTIGFCQYVL